MRLAPIFAFLTFVLGVPAGASTDTDLKQPKIDTRPVSPQSQWGAILIPTRSNSENTLTFSLGAMTGALVDERENVTSSFFDITQTNENHDFTAQEYGVQLLQNGQVGWHWGFKTLMVLGEDFEPYYKFGVGSLSKTSEGLASVVNYQRYQARAAIGLDDLLSWNRQLRAELAVADSALGLSCQFVLGYSFSD